jgi:hypothetical protein
VRRIGKESEQGVRGCEESRWGGREDVETDADDAWKESGGGGGQRPSYVPVRFGVPLAGARI